MNILLLHYFFYIYLFCIFTPFFIVSKHVCIFFQSPTISPSFLSIYVSRIKLICAPVFHASHLTRVSPLHPQGVRELGLSSECDQHGPCMNGGRCYSGDQGPRCDCSRIAYEGPYCEKGQSSLPFLSTSVTAPFLFSFLPYLRFT